MRKMTCLYSEENIHFTWNGYSMEKKER